MQIIPYELDCRTVFNKTLRSEPFYVVIYRLFYYSNSRDKALVDDFINKASALKENVNGNAANGTKYDRGEETLLSDCLMGIMSEYFWKYYLNAHKYLVKPTPFHGAIGQIDLELVSSHKTIEVRSSCVKNGHQFAICHPEYQFDILGPYHNPNYKPEDEVQKDFYVRTLFEGNNQYLANAVKRDGFCVFLVGGATKKMMSSEDFIIRKDLLADGEVPLMGNYSQYLSIPFSKALDTRQIQQLVEQD